MGTPEFKVNLARMMIIRFLEHLQNRKENIQVCIPSEVKDENGSSQLVKLSWSFYKYIIGLFVGNIIDLGSGKMSIYSANGIQHGDIEHDKNPTNVWAHIKGMLMEGVWQSRVKSKGITTYYADAKEENEPIKFEPKIIIYATGIWRNGGNFKALLRAIVEDSYMKSTNELNVFLTQNGRRVEVQLLEGVEEAEWGASCVTYYLEKQARQIGERIILEGGWGSGQEVHVTSVTKVIQTLNSARPARAGSVGSLSSLRKSIVITNNPGSPLSVPMTGLASHSGDFHKQQETKLKYDDAVMFNSPAPIANHYEDIEVKDRVICAQAKYTYGWGRTLVRQIGDVGIVRTKAPTKCRKPFFVEWTGENEDGVELTTGKSEGWTGCNISKYENAKKTVTYFVRRRMAQREFSSRC